MPEADAELVINYDKGIRSEVGRSNKLLLTDFQHFAPLYSQHFLPGARSGVAGHS